MKAFQYVHKLWLAIFLKLWTDNRQFLIYADILIETRIEKKYQIKRESGK